MNDLPTATDEPEKGGICTSWQRAAAHAATSVPRLLDRRAGSVAEEALAVSGDGVLDQSVETILDSPLPEGRERRTRTTRDAGA